MKKLTKSILSLVLAAALCIPLTACGNSGGGSEGGESAQTVTVDGEFDVTYTGKHEVVTEEGGDVLYVHLNWTNNGEEDASFFWTAFYTATQGGEELETGLTQDDAMAEIKPGESSDVTITYELIDTTTPVDIEISGLFEEGGTINVKL